MTVSQPCALSGALNLSLEKFMYDHFAHVEHGDYTPIFRASSCTMEFGYNPDGGPCFMPNYTYFWGSDPVVTSNIFEVTISPVELDCSDFDF